MQETDDRGEHCCCHEAVEPVHQPAVAGNEMARILGAEAAFDGGFEQVPGLREHRSDGRSSPNATTSERPAAIATASAAAIAASVPPIAPDQVFFGLMCGASFGPPSARPTK